MRKSLFYLIIIILVCPGSIYAQYILEGTVLDEKSQPLIGAVVQSKNGSVGTQADLDGNFTINLPADETAVLVSYVGYIQQEVPVSASSGNITVTLLPDTTMLNEIVVVGYGTQKKRDVTGSVVSVEGKALQEVPSANIQQSLTGRAAGVDIARTGTRPGASGQIRIRGNRSLTASNDPLIVVDGIPFVGDLNDLNNNDIDKIDILKDASATAIYGSRGSNGVILITTRRGTIGKPRINFDTYSGVTQIISQYKVFNADEFRAFRDTSGYGAGASPYSPAELAGIQNGTNTNWQDHLFKGNGYVTNHQLSVSGGTEEGQYSLGGGYFKEQGIIPGQSFDRLSLRGTIDQNIGKRIRVGLNTLNTLNYTKGESLESVIYNTLRISPLTSPYNPDGSINVRPLVGTVDENSTANPLTLSNTDAVVQKRRRLRTFNSLYGEFKFFEGLKYRLNIGLDFRHSNFGSYTGPNTILNSAITNIDATTASVQNGEAWTYVIENLLMFDRTFFDKHRVNFTALYSVQEDQANETRFNISGVPADYIQYYNYRLANGTITVPSDQNTFSNNAAYNRRGLLSYMARINYAFNDKYLITATLRRDGSSVLSPGNQYFTYPAVSLGWNIDRENFLKNIPVISTLKLRGGWGKTSNQSIDPYSTLGGLSTNRYNYGATNVIGYVVTSLPNPNLFWESTSTVNLGIDFGILNNRITGSVDVYQQNTKDLLLTRNLPPSNGAGSIITNAARTQGKGLEILISSLNIKSPRGFTWNTDLNFSMNREKIVELETPRTTQNVGSGWFVGQPINVIYDYTKAGIWQTADRDLAATYNAVPGQIRIADINNDGKIDANDRSVIGNYQPKWVGGITNRFSFMGVDLTVVIFGRFGNKLATTYYGTNSTGNGYPAFNSGRVNQLKVDYWTAENPTNEFPKPVNNNDLPYSSTLNYFDGSFIRVRSINLGYTIPAKLINKAGIEALRVYVSTQNPFILYSPFVRDGYGIDPEGTGIGGAVPTQGETQPTGNNNRAITVGLNAPPTRQFIIGLNITL